MGQRVQPVEQPPVENKPRRNGFSCPTDLKQVSQWITFFLVFLYTSIIAIPLINLWQLSLTLLLIWTFCFLVTQWMATHIDPRDKSVEYADGPAKFKKTVTNPHVIRNLYCQICKVAVEKETKHCRTCNKCVERFDHHCDWLNNCVGKRNYKWFISTVVSAIVLSSYVLCINVALLIGINLPLDENSIIVTNPFIGDVTQSIRIGVSVATGILIFLLIIIIIFLLQLFSMHVYFIRNGITTYEYIIQKRIRKAEKQREAAEKQKDAELNAGLGNASFDPVDDPSRLKSASTVITVTDVGMRSNGMSSLAGHSDS